MTLSPELAAFCRARGIQIRESSDTLVVLNRVPVNGLVLSKTSTNLCASRVPATGQFVVWVDPDLRARNDRTGAARFLSGWIQGQWQLVAHEREFATAKQAIEETFKLLNEQAPAIEEAMDDRVLRGKVLQNVGTLLRIPAPATKLLHRDRVIELATRLFLHSRGLVVLAGPSGSGLTACAAEILRLSRQSQADRGAVPQLVRLDCVLAAAETLYPAATDERIRQLLADCLALPDTWYLLDNVQWPLRGNSLAQGALIAAIERGLRGVATFQTDLARRAELLPNLSRRMHWFPLPALEPGELAEVLSLRADLLHAQNGLQVEPETLTTCLQMSSQAAGAEPARCLGLLESAAALVHGAQPGRVGPDEVAAVRPFSSPKS